MGLQLKLIIVLVGLLVALGGLAGFGTWSYTKGKRAGSSQVKDAWDQSIKEADERKAEDRREGFRIASALHDQLRELEARNARTNGDLRKALNRQLTCPASGRVGDVVLPAALIDSMFNRDQPRSDPPGPAASGVAR